MAASPRRLMLRIAGLVVLAWIALSGVLLARVGLDVRAGKSAADGARGMSGFAEVADGRPIPKLDEARQRFGRAEKRAQSPLLTPVRLLPVLGRQLRSVTALSKAASNVAGVGEQAMTEGRELLRQPSGTSADRVRLVTALGGLAERTRGALQPISLGPRDGLVPPLARARNKLADDLAEVIDGLQRGSTGAGSVARMLAGPRRYLLFAANNSEMRAGAGMFLSVGELEIDGDGMRLGDMRSVTDVNVPAGAVALEGDLAARWGWLEPNREWRNLMTSPRFDAAAPLAASMWVAAGNRPVDGVLAVDPVALAGLLEATGPVAVDGRQLDKDGLVEELLHGQYYRYGSDERTERQEELGRLARVAFGALDSGTSSLPGLAAGLTDSARGRHLLLWSSHKEEQTGWEALRVDGALQQQSLLLAVVNRAANKLDRFLGVSSDISFTRQGPDTEVQVKVTLRNQVPSGEPAYVLGVSPNTGVAPGVYLGIVTLDIPGSASDARFEGIADLAVSGGDGPVRVIGFQLQLEPGESRTIVGRFRLPGHRGTLRVEPSARVPATTWTGPLGKWVDNFARLLFWNAH